MPKVKAAILDSIHVTFLIDMAIRTQLLGKTDGMLRTDLVTKVRDLLSGFTYDSMDEERLGLMRMIQVRLDTMDGIRLFYTDSLARAKLVTQGEDQAALVSEAFYSILSAANLVLC